MWFLASTAAMWAEGQAATLHVPSDHPTITAAVAAAVDGDSIEIASGDYDEHVWIDGLSVTFQGRGATWTAPVWASQVLKCTGSAFCTVVGVTFDGGGLHRAIDVETGAALLVDGATFRGGAANNGGAIRASSATALLVSDAVFEGNAASGSGGHVYASGTPFVAIVASELTGGFAGIDGGAIRITSGTEVLLSDLWLEGNVAGDDGGAVDVDATDKLDLVRSMVCNNVAADEGGGVVVRDATSVVRGNLLVGNVARAGGGLMGASNDLVTENNHFVANEASDAGSGVFATGIYRSVNDLFAHNRAQLALEDAVSGATGATVSYGAFWSNGAGDTDANLPTNTVTRDPVLGGVPPYGCDPVPLQPTFGSSLIDAGDPAISDADGTRSDIGAFGGSAAYPQIRIDEDGDGFDSLVDCDDGDPQRYPGAPERCNGLDDDCDGVVPADEVDNDGDGWLACVDCDDVDPLVYPGGVEIPCNGVDDDCDPSTPDDADADGDGLTICAGDCDDTDEAIPGPEVPGDGIDQDCDGMELCFPDTDGDGRGEPGAVPSESFDCSGPGEAPANDDVCIGFDDRIDPDGDGVPTGCDPCPFDNPDDSDGDGVCDSLDRCPGGDDRVDEDGNGVPDDCDPLADADGDGVVDAVDPDPADAGGRRAPPPDVQLGWGCASTPPAGVGWLWIAGILGLRRRERWREPRPPGALPDLRCLRRGSGA